jgi:hypothetical protein
VDEVGEHVAYVVDDKSITFWSRRTAGDGTAWEM